MPLSRKEEIELIRASGLFDENWYLSEYGDVASLGMNPVEHYLWIGARLMRNPSREFDTAYYLERYGDVRRSGVNPFVHYVRRGRSEGRQPAPEHGDELTVSRLSLQAQTAYARMTESAECPTIIVPVYNAPEETKECIESVLRHMNGLGRLMVIDDASPDPTVASMLEGFRGDERIVLLRNPQNMGFTRTVNRGIEEAGVSDVVFLNSDTIVTPRWLHNLRLAAYSSERVATATPFSDNAGAFSAPHIGTQNLMPANVDFDTAARMVARVSQHIYPSIPTGNGFCMYVRRSCIDEIGALDAAAFPRGYGEENDFCMRALAAGWTHVIDDASYIHHVRSASFGDEKTPLMKAGRAIIDERYPHYGQVVREFLADRNINQARERVREGFDFAAASEVKPRALYVIATRTGGTPQTNEDLMRGVADALETFVLHSDSRKVTLFEFRDGEYIERESVVLPEAIMAFPHRSDAYDAVVRDWLVRYAFELMHIRHIGWHSLGLIDEAHQLGIPIAFSFHDFYTVCPTVKLLDDKMQHCGGMCTSGVGRCQMELWKTDDYPSLKHSAVHEWRRQLEPALRKCDLFFTTAASARDQIASTYPFLHDRKFEVIPHGRDFAEFEPPAAPPRPGEKLRILVPGNISRAKGGDIISELGRRSAQLGIELHILGKVARAVDTSQGIVVHGEYRRDEFVSRVRSIRPHIGAIFSIWPETYCHTLTEMWVAGLPVLAFDLGAVGERINHSQAGWVLKDVTAQTMIDALAGIVADQEQIRSASRRVLKAQDDIRGSGVDSMSRKYKTAYAGQVELGAGF